MIYPDQAVQHEYDPKADALYMRVRPGKVARTLEIGDGIHLDVDAKGWMIGVEVICPAAGLLRRLDRLAADHQAPPLIRLKE